MHSLNPREAFLHLQPFFPIPLQIRRESVQIPHHQLHVSVVARRCSRRGHPNSQVPLVVVVRHAKLGMFDGSLGVVLGILWIGWLVRGSFGGLWELNLWWEVDCCSVTLFPRD